MLTFAPSCIRATVRGWFGHAPFPEQGFRTRNTTTSSTSGASIEAIHDAPIEAGNAPHLSGHFHAASGGAGAEKRSLTVRQLATAEQSWAVTGAPFGGVCGLVCPQTLCPASDSVSGSEPCPRESQRNSRTQLSGQPCPPRAQLKIWNTEGVPTKQAHGNSCVGLTTCLLSVTHSTRRVSFVVCVRRPLASVRADSSEKPTIG